MIWAGIVFTAISYTAFLIAWILCSLPFPYEAGWSDPIFLKRTSLQTPAVSLGLGALGTFTDFYIIAIPLTAISRLHMSMVRKIGLSALFATGLVYALDLPKYGINFTLTLGFITGHVDSR